MPITRLLLSAKRNYMLRIFAVVGLSLFLFSCKKDSTATTSKVKYECNCTPLLGATLTGTIIYSTPTSTNNSGSLTNNTWSFTQERWTLKTGDKVTAAASIQGNSNCILTIYVNDAIKTFRSQRVEASGQNPTNSITVEYIVP